MPEMTDAFAWPDKVSINAYTGTGTGGVEGAIASQATGWVLRNVPPSIRTFLRPAVPADPRDWRDPRVGWGLILAEPPGLSPAQLATAQDAPEPIRVLVAERGGPVLRYRPDWPQRFRFLRNYKDSKDIALSGAPVGTSAGALPRYLLIYGGPEQVPWDLQFLLNANTNCSVGRLDLEGPALENYILALRQNWAGAGAQSQQAVVWSVNHHPLDITAQMRHAIGEPVFRKYEQDTDMQAIFLDGQTQATGEALARELAARTPGIIVSTSHGQTGPLTDKEAMAAQLGWLVDQDFTPVAPSDLLASWQPGGAIWYAHACCSAGSDAVTHFTGLIAEGSHVDLVLRGVAELGAQVAPLPRALLGASQPLRAFIGHVEPTFDWTLVEPRSHQVLTDALVHSLYDELFQPKPVGLALRACHDRLSSLYAAYDANAEKFNQGGETRAAMLYFLLVARDVRSIVILGDPTAMLPPL